MKDLTVFQEKVIEVRGVKVMLDCDVAEALGVEVKELQKNVKRSPKWRYIHEKGIEKDYFFQLTDEELRGVTRFQNATTSHRKDNKPFVYTELGCAHFGTSLTSPEACIIAVQLSKAFIAVQKIARGELELKQADARYILEQNRLKRDMEMLQVEKQKVLLATAEFLTKFSNHNPQVTTAIVEVGAKSLLGMVETKQTTWTVDEFLSSKGISGEQLRTLRCSFGRKMAKAYREKHGTEPYVSMRFIDGAQRPVKSYTMDDMDLFEDTWKGFLE